jgi:hypothetical protein
MLRFPPMEILLLSCFRRCLLAALSQLIHRRLQLTRDDNHLSSNYYVKVKSNLCYDPRSVGQSVLVSCSVWGPKTKFFVTVRQLRVCRCGAPSRQRRRVCHLQLLLALANTFILGSETRGTHDYILLSQIRDSPNMEGQIPVFISPLSRVAQL